MLPLSASANQRTRTDTDKFGFLFSISATPFNTHGYETFFTTAICYFFIFCWTRRKIYGWKWFTNVGTVMYVYYLTISRPKCTQDVYLMVSTEKLIDVPESLEITTIWTIENRHKKFLLYCFLQFDGFFIATFLKYFLQ